MSSTVSLWTCSECGNEEGTQEYFKDTETGFILECTNGCGYLEIYREDIDTGKVIQQYEGYAKYDTVAVE